MLPERGFFLAVLILFLWTLWNNQFSSFDARRLCSLAVWHGVPLKHILLAGLSPDGGWLKKVAGALLQGASLGTLDAPAFAPATGYIAFFTLALYVIGLLVLTLQSDGDDEPVYSDQLALREALLDDAVSPRSVEVSHL